MQLRNRFIQLRDRFHGLLLIRLDLFKMWWSGLIFQYHFYLLIFYIQKHLPQFLSNNHYRSKTPKLLFLLTYLIHGQGEVQEFASQIENIVDKTGYNVRIDHWRILFLTNDIEQYHKRMEQISKEALKYLQDNRIKHTLWLL